MKSAVITAFIALFFISTVEFSHAQNLYKTNAYELGISVGNSFPGKVNVSNAETDIDLTKKNGLMGRIFFDIVISRKTSVGVYYNYADMSFEGDSVNVSMSDFGAAFKYRFLLNKRFAIHPGIGIGYRNLDSKTPIIDSAGLSVNFSVEFIYALTKSNIKAFLDAGLMSEPFGKADEYDVRFYAHPYLNLGVAF